MKEPPEAILFDMDDTILDTHSAGEGAWVEVATSLADELGRPPADLRRALDRGNGWFWDDPERALWGRLDQARARVAIAGRACDELGCDRERVPGDIGQQFLAARLQRLQPFSGALETLRALRSRGCKLALVTNGEAQYQRAKIDKFTLDGYFDAVLVEGELGFGKPDPRVFDLALRHLDTAVDDTWIIGDDLRWEVAGGKRYGMFTVWVDARGQGLPRSVEEVPDLQVAAIAELLQRDGWAAI